MPSIAPAPIGPVLPGDVDAASRMSIGERLAIVETWPALAPWAIGASLVAVVLGIVGVVLGIVGVVRAHRWRAAVLPSVRHDPLAGRMRA